MGTGQNILPKNVIFDSEPKQATQKTLTKMENEKCHLTLQMGKST